MRSDPTRPSALRPHRGRRTRVALLWMAFGVAAVSIAVAVYRLHATVQRELHEQGEAALGQEQAKFRERVRVVTDEVRHATIKVLAAFHVEGLTYALRQWDEGNATVIGTFQWDEAQGFLPGGTFPAGVKRDELAGLWREFRAGRAEHPKATEAEITPVGAFRTAVFRTLENPLFGPGELGYQTENLEMLTYAGRPVDPWAGWAGHRGDASTPWIFWYQPGPGAPVRGCFVDVAPIVAKLQSELTDARLARLELFPRSEVAAAGAGLGAWLPGFAVTGSHGELFVEKQGEARLAALTIVPLLGIFVLGAAFLALFSQRDLRDAERKTTFVTQVSHELRTPLTSIRMFADMLGAPDLPEAKRARFAGTISRESERLGALIERLLMFNALAQGGPPGAVTSVDVAAVVRETLEEMEAPLLGAGLSVEPTLPPTAIHAATDRLALKQALLNLLDNALKYAREGRVIRVALAAEDDGVKLRVADEGPGIPRELGTRVFEPFVQGGRTLTDKSPGVGLGLSIARGLLRQAGGDLVLLSSEKGAVFEIRLPHASPS